MSYQTQSITAVVLTYNEEKNLGACLQSLAGFCPVMLIDSGSTDKTLLIAQNHNATIVQHDYLNHANQWQWVLSDVKFDSDWILAVDADYIITHELKHKILSQIGLLSIDIEGIYIKHRYVFHGSPIRFGGIRHDRLQIVRNGCAQIDSSDMVDCRFIVAGKTIKWKEFFYEKNYYDDDISIWLSKQDKFSLRLAVEEELRRHKHLTWQQEPRFFGSPDQRVTWLRLKWLKLPLFVRPIFYYIYRYIFALGFLDGKGGFLYHLLQGLMLRTIIDWKISQLRRNNFNGDQLLTFKQAMLSTHDGSVENVLALMDTQLVNKES